MWAMAAREVGNLRSAGSTASVKSVALMLSAFFWGFSERARRERARERERERGGGGGAQRKRGGREWVRHRRRRSASRTAVEGCD